MSAYLQGFIIGRKQNAWVKFKGVVALKAGVHVEIRRNADWSFLMHDIDESCDRSVLTCADTFIFHLKLPLVVEIGVAFIAVEGFLVLRGHFPDNDGNCTGFTFSIVR